MTIERTTPISCIAAAYFLAIFLVTSFATAAAAEAAGGLYLHLLLGEGTTQILEGLLCFLGRAVGGMLSGSGVEARNGNACGGGVHRLIIASVPADDLRLTGMYIASVHHCFSPIIFPL